MSLAFTGALSAPVPRRRSQGAQTGTRILASGQWRRQWIRGDAMTLPSLRARQKPPLASRQSRLRSVRHPGRTRRDHGRTCQGFADLNRSVVCSELDSLLVVRSSVWICDESQYRLPQCILGGVEVGDCGHMVMSSQPERRRRAPLRLSQTKDKLDAVHVDERIFEFAPGHERRRRMNAHMRHGR